MLIEKEINKTERIISSRYEWYIVHSSWKEFFGIIHKNNISSAESCSNFWWTMEENADIIETLDKPDGDALFILCDDFSVCLIFESSNDWYNSSLECIESWHMWAVFHKITCRCTTCYVWWNDYIISGFRFDDSWGFSHFKSSYLCIFRIGIISFSLFSVFFLRSWFFIPFFVRRFAFFVLVGHMKSISIFGK